MTQLEFILNKVNETKILTNKAHTQTSAENSMRNQNVKCYKCRSILTTIKTNSIGLQLQFAVQ